MLLLAGLALACESPPGGDTAGNTSASEKNAPEGSAQAASSAATDGPAKPAAAAEPGSVASLREKVTGVLTALKKGDANAAGEYCLGKHKKGLTSYLQEHLDKKDGSRGQAFRTWSGKLGEIRIDGESARVVFEAEGTGLHVLAFRQVEGEWSLDDVPSMSKEKLASWGQVATE